MSKSMSEYVWSSEDMVTVSTQVRELWDADNEQELYALRFESAGGVGIVTRQLLPVEGSPDNDREYHFVIAWLSVDGTHITEYAWDSYRVGGEYYEIGNASEYEEDKSKVLSKHPEYVYMDMMEPESECTCDVDTENTFYQNHGCCEYCYYV